MHPRLEWCHFLQTNPTEWCWGIWSLKIAWSTPNSSRSIWTKQKQAIPSHVMILLNFYWAIILPSNGDKIASNRCGPSFHDPVEATKPLADNPWNPDWFMTGSWFHGLSKIPCHIQQRTPGFLKTLSFSTWQLSSLFLGGCINLVIHLQD